MKYHHIYSLLQAILVLVHVGYFLAKNIDSKGYNEAEDYIAYAIELGYII